MKIRWDRLGGQLGVGFCVLGIILVFLGWNGAASLDRVQSQFPYLISGGIGGLSLVLIGVGLMIVQNQREERARLQASLDEMRRTLERMAFPSGNGSAPSPQAEGEVVAGPNSYHLPTCPLLEGRGSLPRMSTEAAVGQGLRPCRRCKPDESADTMQIPAVAPRRRRKG